MLPIDLATDETAAYILDQIPSPYARILDVGCGDGLLASRLQAQGHDVVAIDESAEMVQQARARGVDARVAGWPSFEDSPFDIILFVWSLHHIHPLVGAVEQAHQLLVSPGRVIVEDSAWEEIDPATAEWFYGIARLIDRCQALVPKEDSFATDLVQSGGDFEFWQHSHDRDLHAVEAMWAALRTPFRSLSETSAPHLYRYLCPVLAENETGYNIVSQVLDMERRLAKHGMIELIGRRFVGVK